MANFKNSYEITAQSEGGYLAGAPSVSETYKGIDRGANPKWSGWAIIDSHKPSTTKAMNAILGKDIQLQAAIIKFYLDNYWNPLKLSQIVDQQIANNCFDESVNQGTGIAGKHLQIACNNVIQHIGAKITPLVVDGVVGIKTIGITNALEAELVYNEINALRRDRYIGTANSNPDFKEWLKVWLQRLVPYNHHLTI